MCGEQVSISSRMKYYIIIHSLPHARPPIFRVVLTGLSPPRIAIVDLLMFYSHSKLRIQVDNKKCCRE
jgi:hypothetical protein